MSTLAIAEAGVRVEIGEICLDTDADVVLESAEALLNAEEHARAASFVFPIDRDRFVRGRGYLRRRLGLALRMAPKDVPLAARKNGKPFVVGHGVRFNLSNSGGRTVFALSSGGDVGIDLEIVDRWDRLDEQLDGLAQMCLTAEEQSALAKLPQRRRVRRFLSYWTAKEARMKLTGEGFGLDPLDISLELSDGRPVGYRRPSAPDAELRFIQLSHPDSICCLAVGRGQQASPRPRK
ncbi:MAG TPA: 4'-phosphopantetheinyl transferase superfamily protein [Phenylobacterium sp.]|jgi:4'-phosphopantetheinyl transferase